LQKISVFSKIFYRRPKQHIATDAFSAESNWQLLSQPTTKITIEFE
jgi:hypothetical protein